MDTPLPALSRTLTLACLCALMALPIAAGARMVMPPAGTIPDDPRELAGARDANGLSLLKRFDHRPWTRGSSIALLPGERELVIADTDNSMLVVVDVATRVVQRRIAVGRRPERLVVAPNGHVFVTCHGSRAVSVVDPVRGVELRSATAGVEPLGLALTPDAKTLLVASSATGELLAFDAETLSLRFSLALDGGWPAAVATHPDGKRAFVSHLHGDRVHEVDLEQQRVIRALTLPAQDTGLPGRLSRRFMTKRQPNLAFGVAVSPGGTRLYVTHTMVDTGAARAAGVGIGGYGMGAAAPIVATVSTFDLETGELSRPEVQFGGNRQSQGDIFTADAQMQQLAQPMAIVPDPAHARLLLVAMGSDRVAVLDAASSDPMTTPMGVYEVGQAPKGVVVKSDGTEAYVHNAHTYDVSVLPLSAPPPASRWQAKAGQAFEYARNPLPEAAARGRRLFTFALDQRIGGANRFGCASCHPSGRHDGMVWHIGAGPRQTPILADRLDGTGPFNWIGTEDKLGDNVRQTVKRLGGSGLKDEEVDALVEYMTRYMSTPDNPSRTGADAQLVSLGKQLFESDEVGCSGCHSPDSRFTDGNRHEVGTTTKLEFDIWQRFGHLQQQQRGTQQAPPGGPPGGASAPMQQRIMVNEDMIQGEMALPMPTEPVPEAPVAYDTPSLRHLWASGPYLHDGSVQTLRELITTGNPDDRMGKTSHLSARQIDGLVAYLRTL